MNLKTVLQKKAEQIRKDVIDVAVKNNAGHIAPSLSCVDILVALYYQVMRYNPQDPLWAERDRLIFSKAHGCYSLYAILTDKGIIPQDEWKGFYTSKSTLLGCMQRRPEYGLEAGCGSLGHGLPIATGLAWAGVLQGKKYTVFCVTGDGELQEGTTWEALAYAVKHRLSNLILIIDRNRLQAMDFIDNVMDSDVHALRKRLEGFGVHVAECDGHNPDQIAASLHTIAAWRESVPRALIAQTTKGFGLRCMEDVPKFHFRIPTEEELRQ